jgi:hypothetical protein
VESVESDGRSGTDRSPTTQSYGASAAALKKIATPMRVWKGANVVLKCTFVGICPDSSIYLPSRYIHLICLGLAS